jgi:hypothetical protein
MSPGTIVAPQMGATVHVYTGSAPIPIPAIITAVWGDGMINATGFKMDGSITSFSSIHPNGHPRAGSITWTYPPTPGLMLLSEMGFGQ